MYNELFLVYTCSTIILLYFWKAFYLRKPSKWDKITSMLRCSVLYDLSCLFRFNPRLYLHVYVLVLMSQWQSCRTSARRLFMYVQQPGKITEYFVKCEAAMNRKLYWDNQITMFSHCPKISWWFKIRCFKTDPSRLETLTYTSYVMIRWLTSGISDKMNFSHFWRCPTPTWRSLTNKIKCLVLVVWNYLRLLLRRQTWEHDFTWS